MLGVADGDGSMAPVAAVAHRHGLPFVCVPAGTRNHFALDLGLDPDDPAHGMTAFGRAVEVRVDLAEVNGRAVVNNVSLGIYAAMVRSRHCGLSPRCSAVIRIDRGFWPCSQARCTLVVSPPRDRPRP